MANMTSAINIQVDKETKDQATSIFKDLGLNMSTAINMFLKQVVKTDGIPFEIKNPKPNRKLKMALKEADDILSGKVKSKGYHNIEEIFKDILDEG